MYSRKLYIGMLACLCLFSFFLLSGCGSSSTPPQETRSESSGKGTRDNTPKVLMPSADQKVTYGNDTCLIDASHLEDGYVMAKYTGTSSKVKLQITGPDAVTYTYDLQAAKDFDTFPLSAGSGSYQMTFYENLSGNKYANAFSQDLEVTLKNEFTPFLYPNQFVNYNASTKTVEKAKELAASANTDLDVVTSVYHFVIDTVKYDNSKADDAASGAITAYLPDVDETLDSKKGICFDYAAILTCMLRSQGIPTKLQIGMAGEIKHAWISTYIKDKGWVDNIIEFDGTNWSLMDPTFAANSDQDTLKKYIGEGNNYTLQFSR